MKLCGSIFAIALTFGATTAAAENAEFDEFTAMTGDVWAISVGRLTHRDIQSRVSHEGLEFDRPVDMKIRISNNRRQVLYDATTTNNKVFAIDLRRT